MKIKTLAPVFLSFKRTTALAAAALLSVSLSPSLASAKIQSQLDEAQRKAIQFSASEQAEIRQTQFIFVDGLLGDIIDRNFVPAARSLRNRWQNSDVVILRPQTKVSISANAEILYEEICALRRRSPHKAAFIIGHSKGAAETLLMALRHPDLITAFGVERYDIISGPIQGTPLLPVNVSGLFTMAVGELTPEQRHLVAAEIFYVRTRMIGTQVTSPLFVPHALLSFNLLNRRNDGLIPTRAQMLLFEGNVFGTDLGVVIGDHNSLLNDTPFSAKLKYRDAFFDVLLKDALLGLNR